MRNICKRKFCNKIKNALSLKPTDENEQAEFIEYRNRDIADMSIYFVGMGIVVFV